MSRDGGIFPPILQLNIRLRRFPEIPPTKRRFQNSQSIYGTLWNSTKKSDSKQYSCMIYLASEHSTNIEYIQGEENSRTAEPRIATTKRKKIYLRQKLSKTQIYSPIFLISRLVTYTSLVTTPVYMHTPPHPYT